MNWKVYGKKRVCPKLIYIPVNLLNELRKVTEVSHQNKRPLVIIWNFGPPPPNTNLPFEAFDINISQISNFFFTHPVGKIPQLAIVALLL